MRFRPLTPAVAALLAAGLTGCGSPAKPAGPAAGGPPAGAGATPSASSAASTPGTDRSTITRPGGTAPGAPTASVGARGTKAPGSPKNATAAPTFGPAKGVVDPDFEGTEQEVPIQASVTPACVMPGGQATLRVHTVPKSKVAFLAMYAGEKSGAQPPWGEGYGGNDKGTANDKGDWQYTWTVAPNAPSGHGRVLVVVATDKKQRAVNVPFSVGGREAGGCGT